MACAQSIPFQGVFLTPGEEALTTQTLNQHTLGSPAEYLAHRYSPRQLAFYLGSPAEPSHPAAHCTHPTPGGVDKGLSAFARFQVASDKMKILRARLQWQLS
jgi:hypothetical protein